MNTYKIKRYDGQFSPAITFTITDTNITKVNIYYRLNNETSYTLATLDTVLTVISGETVYLKYEVVSSSSSSSKLAYWNINGTPSIDTTTEKTITISDTYSSSSYKVEAAGNLNIVSSTIRINTLGTLADNIKTFKIGYYKDSDSVTWVGKDTTITALSTDTYHVQYQIELNSPISDSDSPVLKGTWYLNGTSTEDTGTTKSVVLS